MTIVMPTMGTMLSLTFAQPTTAEPSTSIQQLLEAIEGRFSLHRPDSEASAIACGDLPLTRASSAFRNVYGLAREWEQRTNGAFTPYHPRGHIDLTGIVKGWAIEQLGQHLRQLDLHDWCLNVGGDILADGQPDTSGVRSWEAGIVDPHDRQCLLTSIPLPATRPALATSGYSERGAHIWRANSSPFIQASVAAPDIIMADVLATAIVAGGHATLQATCSSFDIVALAMDDQGHLFGSPELLKINDA